jgi:hypothetical protein
MREELSRYEFTSCAWKAECPKCGHIIEIDVSSGDIDSVYCEGCNTLFELVDLL